MNDKLGSMWIVIVAWSSYYSATGLEGRKKTTIPLTQDSRRLGRDSIRISPEYDSVERYRYTDLFCIYCNMENT
jgi:hypothetical protein